MTLSHGNTKEIIYQTINRDTVQPVYPIAVSVGSPLAMEDNARQSIILAVFVSQALDGKKEQLLLENTRKPTLFLEQQPCRQSALKRECLFVVTL